MTTKAFLQELEDTLGKERFPMENDLRHINRIMHYWGPKIWERRPFDTYEFQAATLLHEIDRSPSLEEELVALGGKGLKDLSGQERKQAHKAGIPLYVAKALEPSNFSDDAKARIIDAIVQHSKMYNATDDSVILSALRLGDKLDRMGVFGIVTAVIHRCPEFPLFDDKEPFALKSTSEAKLNSAYIDWLRVFEWYSDPFMSDEDRELVPMDDFRNRIEMVRVIVKEYAEKRGLKDGVEKHERNLQTVFGRHYAKFAPGY